MYRFLSVLNIETTFAFDLSSLAGPRPRSGEAGSGVRDREREREADMQFDLGGRGSQPENVPTDGQLTRVYNGKPPHFV